MLLRPPENGFRRAAFYFQHILSASEEEPLSFHLHRFPPTLKAMRAWVTDCPNFLSARVIPLKFRYHSAMMGSLGIGCNILKFTDEETELSKDMIRQYKEIRPIVQEGDFYRLDNPSANKYFLYEYLKGEQGLIFVFLPQSKVGHWGTTIRLRGLEEEVRYTLHTSKGDITKSGSYLMYHGLELKLSGDYASVIIPFEAKQ